jgi:hypothetical protein
VPSPHAGAPSTTAAPPEAVDTYTQAHDDEMCDGHTNRHMMKFTIETCPH